MIIETLKKIGLTGNEIRVYISLLEVGSSTTGDIIKKAGLHSSRVYWCLERLRAKGLISYVIKSNKKYFEATNPKRLIDYLEERQKEIEEEKIEIKKIIPGLVAKQKIIKPIQEANIYSGFKGIKSLLNNLLEELEYGGEYYVFGAEGGIKEVLGPYFKLYQKKKLECKIKSKVIFGEKAKKTELLNEYVGEARFISSKYPSPTDTFIYNDKIIIFIWNEKPPFAILIKNKSAAQSYKNYFNLLWKIAKYQNLYKLN